LHIAALTGSAADVNLAGVTVGPNAIPTVDTPMVSTEGLALFGGFAVLLLIRVARRAARPVRIRHGRGAR
jgi:hypothetical protein